MPRIFSAGNVSKYSVAYPANKSTTFAVGAIDLDDIPWPYSQFGENLDIMAPCDDGHTTPVWSIDQHYMRGVNPERYTWSGYELCVDDYDYAYQCHFGGTSAACPIVAGTASLIFPGTRP